MKQLRQPFAGYAGNAQRVGVFPVGVLGQIAFVEQKNFVPIRVLLFEMRRPPRVSIDNVKTQVRRLQGSFRARNSFALEVSGQRAQPGGIEQPDRHAAKVDHFLDRVPRRPVRFADDHPVVAKESIEQTGFAGVGRAVNNNAQAFAQNAALVGGGQKFGDVSTDRIESRTQLFPFIRSNILFREINRCFDLRDKIDQCVADGLDFPAEPAFELLGGGTQSKIGFGAN